MQRNQRTNTEDMITYGFYTKSDTSKEIIYQSKFNSLNQAVEFFAKLKNLNLDSFHNLYEVIIIVK